MIVPILNLENNIKIMNDRISDYKKLHGEYYQYLKTLGCESLPAEARVPKIIWSCWFQGKKNMPPLVRVCHTSRMERFKDWEHIFITAENFEKYTSLDKTVVQKWRSGIIGHTAFSNLVRLDLLERYGGIWADSTILFTGDNFPSYITRSALFLYTSWNWLSGDVRPISTWLISSCCNNPLIKIVKKLLTKYWLDKDYLQTYFIFHMFFRMAIEEYPQLFENVPKVSNVPPHFMQFELHCKYSSERFMELKKMSPIHKLTYKLPAEILSDKNNLYSHLIAKGCEN